MIAKDIEMASDIFHCEVSMMLSGIAYGSFDALTPYRFNQLKTVLLNKKNKSGNRNVWQ